MKNPLRRRFLRELRSDPGKYLVIFFLMVLSIAEISGFLVADESMIAAYNESFEKYNIEDGNFTTETEMKERQLAAVEALDAAVYPLYNTDRLLTNGTTLRLFAMREEVDLACLMEGAFPERAHEIAVDRMYADNNGLSVGDDLTIEDGDTYTITGLVALSDYSTLFESNNDTMFDARQFGVAVITDEAFSAFDRDLLTWRYAWKYDTPPADEKEENDRSEEFVGKLARIVHLTGYVPRYQNQAINFTGEDMGSDRSMMTIFLYIIIIIIAFVFAVTISNTILKEAAVIGTLRATGYTEHELIRHYMTLPVIVTLISAAVGNLLGYTVLRQLNADLYYASYSLPTYVTLWSPRAFAETTVVPLVLMVLINYLVLRSRLRLTPLQFLRRDLRRKQRRRAFPLSRHIPFFSRFRLRIAAQNRTNYFVLAIGILFANLLLLFGLLLPDVLQNYGEKLPDNMFCNYQYVLQLPAGALDEERKVESLVKMLLFKNAVETDNADAEKFSAYSLRTITERHVEELDLAVTNHAGVQGAVSTGAAVEERKLQPEIVEEELILYGVNQDSRYIGQTIAPGEVWVSRAYAEKWMLEPGSRFMLREPYENTAYAFTVTGIYPYDGALAVFMEREDLNGLFDLGESTFSGYFSDTEITDIDEKYIGQCIDYETLSKVSRQLMISMGSMMYVVDVFAMLMFMILIYLLSKIIIEKNASSISMTKILGYQNSEIARLYILVTTILVILLLGGSIPVVSVSLQWIVRMMLRSEMSGWIPIEISRITYIKAFLFGVATYAVVALLEYRRISRVPMDEALKNAE